MNIRQSHDRLIIMMGIAKLGNSLYLKKQDPFFQNMNITLMKKRELFD